VQGTTGVMGQAAGTAAALSVKHDTTPRGIYENHLVELQQELLKDDQYIIDLKNEDPNDLALKAKVSASSVAKQPGFGAEQVVPSGTTHALNVARAVMFASGELTHVGKISLLIKSENTEPTELALNVQGLAKYGSFDNRAEFGAASAMVPPNGEHWVEFPVDITINNSRLVGLFLEPVDGLSWSLMEAGPSSSCRGYLDSSTGKWTTVVGQYYAFYVDSEIKGVTAYNASNVNNGVSRIVDEQMNMWKSDPSQAMPQWVQLDLDEPKAINAAYLTFDTNLNQAKHQTWEWKVTDRIVPESVKDYEVQYYDGSEWVTVVKVEDNYQRRRIHEFPAVTTDKVRLLITRTNGDPSARVYEIRLYNE
jgi:hypothetical protein